MKIFRRMAGFLRGAHYGALMLEMFVLVVGILLALAVDRWNQDRIEGLETARIVERLESDTARNLAMFERTLHDMERNLANVKSLFRALDAGSIAGEDTARIDSAIVYIDVVPSYPLVFSAYEELVATGRLRRLDDPALIDLLGNQRAEYEAAQAVVGYWRDLIQGATDALDQHVDFYYTTEEMNEDGMAARFDFATLAADRNLKNEVFDAVDIHSDWLGLQQSIYELTKQIDARLHGSDRSRSR